MLRRRTAAVVSPPRPSLVVCALGPRRIALPVGRIVAVDRIASYTPLPADDPATLGIALHRGRLIPLVDLGPRLGSRGARPLTLPALCVVVRSDHGELAFPVDEVVGFAPAGDDRFRETVTVLDPAELGGPYG